VTREGLAAFPDMPVPVFGTEHREERMNQLFAFTSANPKHAGWKKVYESVRSALDRQQLQTPYDTVIALETYFRTHYAYDEHVVLSDANGPPLPHWIENGTAGYCQMFSGSMAELLRLLGIPARVAEGFTSGTFDLKKRVYRVTDHDAHAWVEVFFPGYGWLPFDPTPSRGLGTQYSTSSARFALSKTGVVRSADSIGADLDRPATAEPSNQTHHRHGEEVGSGADETLPPPVRHRGSSLVLDVLAVIAGVLALLLVLKQALRLWRLRGDDPRRRAVAYRADLAAYARDQRVDLGDELTHEEVGRRLETQFGVDPAAWITAADRARYAPEPHAAVAARELRGETRRLRREMARSLSVRERAAGAVSLRSVVRQ
jgi:transglutaminase-like putative cysteine protease